MIWRGVHDNPDYEVSDSGLVRKKFSKRFGANRLLSISDNGLGYLYCTLMYSKPKRVSVHRLVAFAFVSGYKEGLEVHHVDHDKGNNCADNLVWVTKSENIKRSYTEGGRVVPTGEDHWNYGNKCSPSRKKKMSEAKKGRNHPKFTGYYIVDGVKYGSAREAADAIGTYPKDVYRKCHREDKFPNYSFKPVRKRDVTKDKSFRGWYYIGRKRYPSLRMASRSLGLTEATILRRVNSWYEYRDYRFVQVGSLSPDWLIDFRRVGVE
jgi:hypothetical protein